MTEGPRKPDWRPQKQDGLGIPSLFSLFAGGRQAALARKPRSSTSALPSRCFIGIFHLRRRALWGFVGVTLTSSIEALNRRSRNSRSLPRTHYSKMAQHAKDLGSFAVFCLLLANGVWAAYVLASLWGWAA